MAEKEDLTKDEGVNKALAKIFFYTDRSQVRAAQQLGVELLYAAEEEADAQRSQRLIAMGSLLSKGNDADMVPQSAVDREALKAEYTKSWPGINEVQDSLSGQNLWDVLRIKRGMPRRAIYAGPEYNAILNKSMGKIPGLTEVWFVDSKSMPPESYLNQPWFKEVKDVTFFHISDGKDNHNWTQFVNDPATNCINTLTIEDGGDIGIEAISNAYGALVKCKGLQSLRLLRVKGELKAETKYMLEQFCKKRGIACEFLEHVEPIEELPTPPIESADLPVKQVIEEELAKLLEVPMRERPGAAFKLGQEFAATHQALSEQDETWPFSAIGGLMNEANYNGSAIDGMMRQKYRLNWPGLKEVGDTLKDKNIDLTKFFEVQCGVPNINIDAAISAAGYGYLREAISTHLPSFIGLISATFKTHEQAGLLNGLPWFKTLKAIHLVSPYSFENTDNKKINQDKTLFRWESFLIQTKDVKLTKLSMNINTQAGAEEADNKRFNVLLDTPEYLTSLRLLEVRGDLAKSTEAILKAVSKKRGIKVHHYNNKDKLIDLTADARDYSDKENVDAALAAIFDLHGSKREAAARELGEEFVKQGKELEVSENQMEWGESLKYMGELLMRSNPQGKDDTRINQDYRLCWPGIGDFSYKLEHLSSETIIPRPCGIPRCLDLSLVVLPQVFEMCSAALDASKEKIPGLDSLRFRGAQLMGQAMTKKWFQSFHEIELEAGEPTNWTPEELKAFARAPATQHITTLRVHFYDQCTEERIKAITEISGLPVLKKLVIDAHLTAPMKAMLTDFSKRRGVTVIQEGIDENINLSAKAEGPKDFRTRHIRPDPDEGRGGHGGRG